VIFVIQHLFKLRFRGIVKKKFSSILPAFLAFRSISQYLKQTIRIKQHLGSYIYILYKKVAKKGALAAPSLKRPKITKRTLKNT